MSDCNSEIGVGMGAQCAQRGVGDQAVREYDGGDGCEEMDVKDLHNRLAGATVVVTRPASSAGPIKRRVRQLGGTALGLPGTTLRKADDAKSTKAALLAARVSDVVV